MRQSLKERTKILNDIHQERSRQDHLHPQELPISDRYVTLGEEIGEVAAAIQNSNTENLYQELIQVAAVAVRMAEQIIEEGNHENMHKMRQKIKRQEKH